MTRLAAAPTQRLLVGLAVFIVLLGVLAYLLAPYRAAGGLKCGATLAGSDAREEITSGPLVNQEDKVCQDKGNSRLLVGGFAGILALVLGVSAVVLPVGGIETLFQRQEEP